MQSRAALLTSIRELERAPTPNHARLVAHELIDAMKASWVDARLARRACEALDRRGLRRDYVWSPAPLATGETYLLLYEPEWREGSAVRVRLVDSADRAEGFGADALGAIDRARQGLAAAIGAAGRALPLGGDLHLSARLDHAGAEISGDSLGVAVAVAIVSRVLGKSPRADIAASAAVTPRGTLAPVRGLREKVAALRASWPSVSRVVVAKGQSCEACEGIEFVECEGIVDALGSFGLEVVGLPRRDIESVATRVAGFANENSRGHSSAEWWELSLEAWEASCALSTKKAHAARSAEAAVWASLFALHAGRPDVARAYREAIQGAKLPPAVAAWIAIVSADERIDDDPAGAVPLAEEAVHLAQRNCQDPRDVWMQGHALGTLGRALLHAGRPHEAERWLRDAVAFHHEHQEYEEARSCVYLATCLRHGGHPAEAMKVVERAEELVAEYPESAISKATPMYLALERGRCLLALGRYAESIDAFDFVVARQAADREHPRSAAIRGLASAYRALGDLERADEALRRCLKVATIDRRIHGKVASMAAGDALLDEVGSNVPRVEIVTAWSAHHPGVTEREAIASVVGTWIY
jgi:tetratricopeptide (TPR) repeat protein